jgi:hypothetical protein
MAQPILSPLQSHQIVALEMASLGPQLDNVHVIKAMVVSIVRSAFVHRLAAPGTENALVALAFARLVSLVPLALIQFAHLIAGIMASAVPANVFAMQDMLGQIVDMRPLLRPWERRVKLQKSAL